MDPIGLMAPGQAVALEKKEQGLHTGNLPSSRQVPSSVPIKIYQRGSLSRLTNQPEKHDSERHEGSPDAGRDTVATRRYYGTDSTPELPDYLSSYLFSTERSQRQELPHDKPRNERSVFPPPSSRFHAPPRRSPSPVYRERVIRRKRSTSPAYWKNDESSATNIPKARGKEYSSIPQPQSMTFINSPSTIHSTISKDLTASGDTLRAARLAELGQKLFRCPSDSRKSYHFRKRKRSENDDSPYPSSGFGEKSRGSADYQYKELTPPIYVNGQRVGALNRKDRSSAERIVIVDSPPAPRTQASYIAPFSPNASGDEVRFRYSQVPRNSHTPWPAVIEERPRLPKVEIKPDDDIQSPRKISHRRLDHQSVDGKRRRYDFERDRQTRGSYLPDYSGSLQVDKRSGGYTSDSVNDMRSTSSGAIPGVETSIRL